MNIYIMRHGEAGYHAASDAERSLTAHGVAQAQQAAHWLKQQAIQFDLALVSPYRRARQTFEALKQILPVPQSEIREQLTPSGWAQNIVDELRLLSADYHSILLVSHLPLVGELVSELCADQAAPMFATAAIAAVSVSANGTGQLQWMHSSN